MTRAEFTRWTGLIASRAASWTHEGLTLQTARWSQPVRGEVVERFVADIQWVLDELEAAMQGLEQEANK